MKIDINKTIFVNVDTQKDFMNESGSLYVTGAEDIKSELSELTKFAEKNNIRVVNTMDYHYDDSEEISDNPDFAETFPPHCMVDTDGANYVEETEVSDPYVIGWQVSLGMERLPNNRNIVIQKDKFDTFYGNPNSDQVFKLIKDGGVDTAVVYGVSGDICVSFVVSGLIERGFKVIIVEDGVASLNPSAFDNSFNIWEGLGATKVKSVNSLIL